MKREREAYWAWGKRDETALLKACEPLISSLANSIAQDSRRNKSDKLRRPSQHSRFEAGLRREAGVAEEDLREAKEVIDFDDLFSVGCEALLDAATRYNPKKGKSPQVFAYKRIRGAMRDLRDEKQSKRPSKLPLTAPKQRPQIRHASL